MHKDRYNNTLNIRILQPTTSGSRNDEASASQSEHRGGNRKSGLSYGDRNKTTQGTNT